MEEVTEPMQPIVSPVARFSQNKKWVAKIFLLIAAAVVIGVISFHHKSKQIEDETPEDNSNAIGNLEAPKVTQINQDPLNEIKVAVSNTQEQAVDTTKTHEESEAEKLNNMRMVAPTTVYSVSNMSTDTQSAASSSAVNSNSVLGGNGGGDSNSQFLSKVSENGVSVVNATRIAHPMTTLAQGTMIWATLETRIVSDLPGMVRAITSEDIFSEDGSEILIPRGSKLLGQYSNGIAQGQSRVFVVWQRVIRPDHIDIQLGSPGTDVLGTAGIGADHIDKHFFEQFGSAVLLSIISAGAANAGVGNQDQFNSSSAYREALANSFAQTAQNTFRATGNIQPTLYINQGTKVSVFVARDLDFYNELAHSS